MTPPAFREYAESSPKSRLFFDFEGWIAWQLQQSRDKVAEYCETGEVIKGVLQHASYRQAPAEGKFVKV
jgi:hypothetical protein